MSEARGSRASHWLRLTRRGTTHSWDLSGRGTTRAEDAQGTPTQSHVPPSILVYEEDRPSVDDWLRGRR